MNKKMVVNVVFAAAFLGATGIFYSCSEKSDTEVMVVSTQTPQPSLTKEEQVTAKPSATTSTTIYVYLCGQVKKPDVYKLPAGARIKDAITLAGGLLKEAAPECVNLARVLEDGEQIYIPSKEEKVQGEYTNTKESGSEPEKSSAHKEANLSVNINSADLNELMTLPGIGEAKATAILAYRDQHGAFGSAEELMNVTGIKTGLYTKIKDYIKVN